MKHLLKMLDLTSIEIKEILNLADQLKYENQHGIKHHRLEGQSLGMIFQKSSTRTRVSFEVGMYQLGGQALFLSNRDLQIGRGEPVQDTARVLSRYLDGIMIRTFAQDVYKRQELGRSRNRRTAICICCCGTGQKGGGKYTTVSCGCRNSFPDHSARRSGSGIGGNYDP